MVPAGTPAASFRSQYEAVLTIRLNREFPLRRVLAYAPELLRAPGDTTERGSLARVLPFFKSTEVQILLAAAVLFVVFSVLYPDSFFSTGTFLNMARVAGILLVVSLGQSFAIIIGGFDTFPLARIWALSASSSHSSW